MGDGDAEDGRLGVRNRKRSRTPSRSGSAADQLADKPPVAAPADAASPDARLLDAPLLDARLLDGVPLDGVFDAVREEVSFDDWLVDAVPFDAVPFGGVTALADCSAPVEPCVVGLLSPSAVAESVSESLTGVDESDEFDAEEGDSVPLDPLVAASVVSVAAPPDSGDVSGAPCASATAVVGDGVWPDCAATSVAMSALTDFFGGAGVIALRMSCCNLCSTQPVPGMIVARLPSASLPTICRPPPSRPPLTTRNESPKPTRPPMLGP